MFPEKHIFFGGVASFLIWLFFPSIGVYAIVIFLSSFLIDVDHYIEYAVRQKDISLINALKYYYRKFKFFKKIHKKHWRNYKEHYLIFHTIESWVVIALLGFIHPVFWFILLGFGVHMILDYATMLNERIIMLSKISLIATILSNKNRTVVKIGDWMKVDDEGFVRIFRKNN